MSLITCPECKRQISEFAGICPNCGNKLFSENFLQLVMRHIRRNENTYFICAVFFVIILAGTITSNNSENSTNNPQTTAIETNTSLSSVKPNSKLQTTDDLKEQLKREISSFDKPFDNSNYNETVEALQIERALFIVWANLIYKGENNTDEENQKLAAYLKKKVIALQIKEFPRMRVAYCDVVAKKLWENDVYASTQGGTNGIINFTGGLFAANKNIQETQTLFHEILIEFRFKEARYRWYKEADEYTSYKIDSSKDNVLVWFE